MHPIVLRFARSAARSTARILSLKPATRAFSVSASRWSGPSSPSLFGEGSKPGEVPTDISQSTGLDRLQTLGNLEGIEAFDLNPLDSSRTGTLENPVLVYSLDSERIFGCTGSPADSHDVHWYTITKDEIVRCGECGSAHKMDYHGSGEEEHHH